MRFDHTLRAVALVVLALFAAGASPALSSPFSVTRHVGVSLRRVSMRPGVAARPRVVRSVPLRVADPASYRRAKAEALVGYRRWLRDHPTTAGASRGRAPLTSVSGSLNHRGLAASDQDSAPTPPDTTGAAGPSNYVEMVNSELAVYSNTDLSAPTETMAEPDFVGDPGARVCDGNVEWDEAGGRWLYSATGPCTENSSTNVLYFGWSRTSSPTLTASNWCQYAIDTGTSTEDFPKLGHDDSQILIGVNEFGDFGDYAKVYVVDKPANGDTSCPDPVTEGSTAAVLTLGTVIPQAPSPWTPVAANLADVSPVGYVVATDLDGKHLHLYTVGRDDSQANVLLDSQTVSVRAYCVPPSVPQKGTAHTIESLDARLTQAVAVTDPSSGHEGIWTQQTISASCKNGQSGPSVVRWYELAPATSTPTQTGTVRGAKGVFVFMGAISPSADGQNAAIFYNTSSKTTLPQFHVLDRHLDTTSGQMVEDARLASSTSPDEDFSCNYRPCRWGDYNGASPDPSDASLIWGTGEITVSPPHTVTHAAQWGSENAAIDVTPAATYTLQVTVTDTRTGTGSVSSSPDGIPSCTSSCAHVYPYGAPVQLTATPGAHSIFHWSGDCSGAGACTVSMGGPQNITAIFLPQPETLSYTRAGNGSGRVTFLPTGVHCKASCVVPFDYGTRVRLTARAASGSVFKRWSGACRGHRTCTVTMNDAKTLKATFAKLRR